MSNVKKLTIRFFELFFFAIPLLLVIALILSHIFSIFLGLDISNPKPSLEVWKEVRNVLVPLYIGSGCIGVYLFESVKPVDTVRRNLFLKRLLFGLVLLIFSYAIAGILVDIGFLTVFVFLSVVN